MSTADKISNTANKAKGKAQEAAGSVSGDDELKAKGMGNQLIADVKQAGKKLKDAFKR